MQNAYVLRAGTCSKYILPVMDSIGMDVLQVALHNIWAVYPYVRNSNELIFTAALCSRKALQYYSHFIGNWDTEKIKVNIVKSAQ